MILAFLRILTILAVIVFAIVFPEKKIATGSVAILLGVSGFVFYLIIQRLADGVQHTTLNLTRIFLVRTQGSSYHHSEIDPIQTEITPISLAPIVFGFVILAPLLIALMAFTFGGWWTLILVSGVTILSPVLPVPYRMVLKRIYRHLSFDYKIALRISALGYSYNELLATVSDVIKIGHDPIRIWHQELEADISQKLTSRR